MAKQVLFVGLQHDLYEQSCYEKCFAKAGFNTIRATTFANAVEILRKRKIDLMFFFAFEEMFSKEIDECPDELPPIIYRYIAYLDRLPNRPGVQCVETIASPFQIVEIANKIILRELRKEMV